MPPRARLEVERSFEISLARLPDRFGCGLMLKQLPKYDRSEGLLNVMGNYGYKEIYADPAAQKTLGNRGLLKSFYENSFEHKVDLRRNYHQTFREQEMLLAYDPRLKHAWFVAEPQNRMALTNYYRDAVTLSLKTAGIVLTGALVRLTPVGWQNLHDLLDDAFLERNKVVRRIEVMSVLPGVRWRDPHLGVGVTFLNFRELKQIKTSVLAALRGESGADIEN